MSRTERPAPQFRPGDMIASELYMGTVQNAFWDDTWCYNIGENASTDTEDKAKGYMTGRKFIRHGDIIWKYYTNLGEWREV